MYTVVYTDAWMALYVEGSLEWAHHFEDNIDANSLDRLISILTKVDGVTWRVTEVAQPRATLAKIIEEERRNAPPHAPQPNRSIFRLEG